MILLFLCFILPTYVFSQTEQERQALIDLYNHAGGKAWRRQDNWLTSKSICTWFGVTCSNTTNRRILQFSLYDNLLEGTIPASLSALDSVEYFALSTNKLHGAIPQELGKTFRHCKYFDLRYNFLNGSFPIGFSNMKNLTHLILSNNNFHDHDTLATIVTEMNLLQYFDVRSNYLTGQQPMSLCNFKNLTFCGLVDPKFHTNTFNTPIAKCLQEICVV
jgi:hypothetical protein